MKKLTVFLLFFLFSGSANAVDLKFWKIFKKDKFIVGINYPWNHYGADVGINPYGKHMGFSAEESVLEEDFAKFQKADIKDLIIFVFADGRGQIVFNENGDIKTYQIVIARDSASLFKTAKKYNIRLWLVLFDFYIGRPHKDGTFKYRYPEIIFNQEKKEQYFERVLIPVLKIIENLNKKLGKPVFAIAPMNEPENMPLAYLPGNFTLLKEWNKEVLQLIKEHTSIKTFFSSNSYLNLKNLWSDINVDIWHFHYYSHMEKKPAYEHIDFLNSKNLSIFPKGKIMVGELDPAYIGHIKRIKKNGFAGVFFWSYKARDQYGSVDLEKIKSQIAR